MKQRIELVMHPEPDGRRFINFWGICSRDICCQIIDGKLMLSEWDYDKDVELPKREITFTEFTEMVYQAGLEEAERFKEIDKNKPTK